tara:strand:+ start:406 stop:636 length:231 start_codon:yes stop_codon:yes gene_type:complete
MSSVKIRQGQTGFYQQYANKKVALLEQGQSLKVNRIKDDLYICSVVNATERCKDHGGYDGMTVEAYVQNLEIDNQV